MARQKHVPQRTCIVCKQVFPKRELLRIVRTPEAQLLLDETGKAQGRGAYLCQGALCRDNLSKNHVSRALKSPISDAEWMFFSDNL